METALQQTAMSETQDSEQQRAAEDDEVKIIDLEHDIPLVGHLPFATGM